MKATFLRQWSAILTAPLPGPVAPAAKPYLHKTTRRRHQVVAALTYRGVLYLH